MPSRKYSIANTNYRYGFNGKENDNDIENGAQDYGMRIYDGRLARFLSADPLSKKYPWYSPYQFAGNNPIAFIDLDGLEPGVKGTVKAMPYKYTDAELKQSILTKSANIHSGLSVDYLLSAARQEGLSLKIYDIDGDTKRGGNATIGFGSLVHYGSLGNIYYDKKALSKEAKYHNGITFSQAVDMFINETNNNAADLNNWFVHFKIDKSLISRNEIDVLADIYFNSGTKNTKKAFAILAKNGQRGLIEAIKNGTIKNISKTRKNFRLNILENGNYSSKIIKKTPPIRSEPPSVPATKKLPDK